MMPDLLRWPCGSSSTYWFVRLVAAAAAASHLRHPVQPRVRLRITPHLLLALARARRRTDLYASSRSLRARRICAVSTKPHSKERQTANGERLRRYFREYDISD